MNGVMRKPINSAAVMMGFAVEERVVVIVNEFGKSNG
jgi:hypothetical protein